MAKKKKKVLKPKKRAKARKSKTAKRTAAKGKKKRPIKAKGRKKSAHKGNLSPSLKVSASQKSTHTTKALSATGGGVALKNLYSTSSKQKPNLEFEKQFENELESFDEKKHSLAGEVLKEEEEEEEFSPDPPKDEELFNYDDEDLEY